MKRSGARIGTALLLFGFAVALAIRARFLAALPSNYDMVSWKIVANILERGGNVYHETSRYNYSPLWGCLLVALDVLGRAVRLPLYRMVSLFLLGVDLASAVLLRAIALERGHSRARAGLAALLFFANPVSVIVSSYQGAFDNLSILFLLLALLFAFRRYEASGGIVGALSVSLLAKHITWFHPVLFAWRSGRRRALLATALVPYAVFLLSFVPFWRGWEGIRAHVFGYRGLDEPYGVELLGLPRETTTALLVLAALTAIGLLRRVEVGRSSLLLMLVLLIFAPGICPYYFVWPIALGALYPTAGFLVYTVVVTAFLVHSPDVIGLELRHLPGWSGPWWALVFWLLWEIRLLRRESWSRIVGMAVPEERRERQSEQQREGLDPDAEAKGSRVVLQLD
jgi:hypothetical protein